MENTINKIPIIFEKNINPNYKNVKYIIKTSEYQCHFLENEITLYLSDVKEFINKKESIFSKTYKKILNSIKISNNNSNDNYIKIKFNNCSQESKLLIHEQLPYNINYIKGNDENNWILNKEAYTKIKNENIYDNIDLIYYEKDNNLTYDFIVKSKANPNNINFTIENYDTLSIDEYGDLQITKNNKNLVIRKPKTYQLINKQVIDIDSKYIIIGSKVKFLVDKYDNSRDLIIDPTVEVVHIIEGENEDILNNSIMDNNGNIYLVGKTLSIDFPPSNNIYSNSNYDSFLIKLNNVGEIVYSLRISGNNDDEAISVVVDNENKVYITGETNSTDFPLVNPIQSTNSNTSIFLMKLNIKENTETLKEEGEILFSSYIGGKYNDYVNSIDLDKDNNIYLSGSTNSYEFPTYNINDTEINKDIYILKLRINNNGEILKNFKLNGENGEVKSIKLDNLYNIYVTGLCKSDKFPIYNEISKFVGDEDIYIIKLDKDFNIKFATYLNKGKYNCGNFLAVDENENIYITGYFANDDKKKHLFITSINKFNQIILDKEVAGNREEEGRSIDINNSKIYVAGYTTSSNFPIFKSCIIYDIGKYGFLTKLDSNGEMIFSTYVGQSDSNTSINSINIDSNNNIYMSGETNTNNMYFLRGESNKNIFISKISQEVEPTKKEILLDNIDTIVKIPEVFINKEYINDLYCYVNKIDIRQFEVYEKLKTKETLIDIQSCHNTIGIIEYRYIEIFLGAGYEIAIVKGNKCGDDFSIYELEENYISTTIDYGCLGKNEELPVKDDFKIILKMDSLNITKVSDNYICHIIAEVYLEY